MNPIIRHKFTADPTIVVFNDVLYLYTGHDESPLGSNAYVMNDWLCFSTSDLVHWQEHPVPLRATDFAWAKGDAYASKVVFHQGVFYWYAAVTHREGNKAIGVAKSNHPVGPFRDAKGEPLIAAGDIAFSKGQNFDPSVIMDGDEAYIFWGKGTCYYAKLDASMTRLAGPIHTVDLPDFQEGIHIHKRNGWYYLCFGYQFPERVAYAMSRSVQGPWKFMGVLNDIPFNCETNRPGPVEFRGDWYFFYHNGALPGGGSQRRSVCLDRLYYNDDGTLKKIAMTEEGVMS
jgi:beta-xylosidase